MSNWKKQDQEAMEKWILDQWPGAKEEWERRPDQVDKLIDKWLRDRDSR